MSVHFEDVPCPCPWCRAGIQSAHRLRRVWFDDAAPPSPEAKAIMDKIVRDAIAAVVRRSPE